MLANVTLTHGESRFYFRAMSNTRSMSNTRAMSNTPSSTSSTTSTTLPQDIARMVEVIHHTPRRMVLQFAGAGSQGLAWLHALPGSSRTVIEASDRYASASLIDALGYEPKPFTSLDVASDLAKGAFARAGVLEPHTQAFGVGLTATIATGRQKRGEHRLALATWDSLGSVHITLQLAKGQRDRDGEEALVSRVLLYALALAAGARLPPESLLADITAADQLTQTFVPHDHWQGFAEGTIPLVHVADGVATPTRQLEGQVLLSGSFNPVHKGHLELAQAASEHVGAPACFELPLANADKATIDLMSAYGRLQQFAGVAPVLLSHTPLFVDKARLFPKSTFVVGADTAARLVDPRFYDDDPNKMTDALEQLRVAGCQVLVAGRLDRTSQRFVTLADIDVPERLAGLFTALDFRQDISSTALRGD